MAKRKKSQQVSHTPPAWWWTYPEEYRNAAFEMRIGMMAERSGYTPAEYQEMLRNQERAGLLTIMYMDDTHVVACWHAPKIARALGGIHAPRVAQ